MMSSLLREQCVHAVVVQTEQPTEVHKTKEGEDLKLISCLDERRLVAWWFTKVGEGDFHSLSHAPPSRPLPE